MVRVETAAGKVSGKAETIRRIWTAAEKAAIVTESFEPNAIVVEVARRHGLNRRLLSSWRREARETQGLASSETQAAFTPIAVRAPALQASSLGSDTAPIEVTIGSARIKIRDGADAGLVAALVKAVMETAERV
jgi:transposase